MACVAHALVGVADPRFALGELDEGSTYRANQHVHDAELATREAFELTREALAVSGTQCVTVAVRRVNLDKNAGPSLLDFVDRKRYAILPTTAGCFDAASAIRTSRRR